MYSAQWFVMGFDSDIKPEDIFEGSMTHFPM